MVGRILVLAGSLCLMLGPCCVGAAELDLSRPQQLRLAESGQTVLLTIRARKGDYLKGTAIAAGGRFTLDLVDGDGRHLRRLADRTAGRIDFRLVANGESPQLKATAIEAGALTLTLDERIAEADQTGSTVYLSPAVAALARDLAAGGTTDAFWQSVQQTGTPMVEPGPDGSAIVTFLARGASRNVRLFGAPSGDHEQLDRLAGSDTWFKSFTLPLSTRLSYQLAPDVPDLPGTARERRVAILATAKADPFNRRPWPADVPDAYATESVLELPQAPPQPGSDESGAPAGTLSELQFASRRLGNDRLVTIYRPAGFNPADPRTVLLIVFDANAYLHRVRAPAILDALIAARRLPPVVAAFVSEIDQETRSRELPGNPAFADAMAEELLPLLRRATGLAAPASRTILAGSSYGGLAAATIALRHPEAFGNALCLSGSFWWRPTTRPPEAANFVAGEVARQQPRTVRFHLTAGLFETAHNGVAGILDTSRHLRDVLIAKGYRVSYREYAGGHDYLVWRGALADGLIALTD